MILLPTNVKASPKTIIVPDDCQTVTSAIAMATSGDTIVVKSGTYNERTLEINKALTISSEVPYQAKIMLHPPSHIINIWGANVTQYDNCITIQADNVKFSGFEIWSEGGDVSANGNQIQIASNTFDSQTHIQLEITGNGSQAVNNTLSNLVITGTNQIAAYNSVGSITVSGSSNVAANNIVGDLSLIGSNSSIIGNSIGGRIQLDNADFNQIINNTIITSGTVGILLGFDQPPKGGSYNVFAGNIVEGAKLWGVLLGKGNYNVFYGNLIANNGGLGHDGYGLAIGGNHLEVNNNLFYQNIFINNSKNFATNWEVIGSNFFDNGTIGNYWDDYLTKYPDATQIGNSGIGNTPYLVYGNISDNFPLLTKPNIPPIDVPIQSLLNSTASPNATSAVPELPWMVIVPLLLSVFSVALMPKHRKTVKLSKINE